MRGALLVCRKEFLELSRDRRTLFFTFFVPVLLYPLVFFMIAGLGQRAARQRQERPSRIVLVDPARVLEPGLKQDGRLFQLLPVEPGQIRRALKEGDLDLQVIVAEPTEPQLPLCLRVLVDATEPSGVLALDRLRENLRQWDQQRIQGRLEALHAAPGLLEPSRLAVEDTADAGLEAGKVLGSFLPYVLMLMMFQGAMQHGIYVTAGEKERGTLQTLLATRLARDEIIWGKLIYIFVMGLVAALLNLASLGISLALVVGQAATGKAAVPLAVAGHLSAMADPVTLLLSFLLLVPLGLLFSSFILFMGIRARNTAEAGTSLMPGLVLILLLGTFSLAPGLERMTFLTYVPILNVSLAIRNLFGQQGNTLDYLLALAMTSGLAVSMTWAAARLLDREEALFNPY
jgi:sodium transport system permease protein